MMWNQVLVRWCCRNKMMLTRGNNRTHARDNICLICCCEGDVKELFGVLNGCNERKILLKTLGPRSVLMFARSSHDASFLGINPTDLK